MNVLITGGAGFIGSSLAERLAQHADNYVVVLDNLLSGYVANVPQTRNIRFIKGDANDYNTLSAIMHRYHFEYVFHYAALSAFNAHSAGQRMCCRTSKALKTSWSCPRIRSDTRVLFLLI